MKNQRKIWAAWRREGIEKYCQLKARLLAWGSGRDLHEPVDFADDAEWLLLEQHPARSRLLIASSLGLLTVGFVWALLAQVDEIARAEGKVVPSLLNQHIQSLDGGVVEQILVREGQQVSRGELLVRIDRTRAQASLEENQAVHLALKAKAARLQALADNQPLNMPPTLLALAPDAVQHEQALYQSRHNELVTNLSMATSQRAQRRQELNEARSRRVHAESQLRSASKQLGLMTELKAAGVVSEVELMQLERELARARSERDSASAQITRLQAAVTEADDKIRETELSFRNAARNELTETLSRLNSLSAGSVTLQDKVRVTEVRAPKSGIIKRLHVNTIGSVIQPGKDILELVPLDDTLVVEARVAPKDIATLHPGQRARLRFSAYDHSVYGALQGEVHEIGADTVADEKGQAFYLVKIITRRTQEQVRNWRILPGMQVQADILIGKKSILSYLFKPILRAKAEALSER